jgi:hypothetical protein
VKACPLDILAYHDHGHYLEMYNLPAW